MLSAGSNAGVRASARAGSDWRRGNPNSSVHYVICFSSWLRLNNVLAGRSAFAEQTANVNATVAVAHMVSTSLRDASDDEGEIYAHRKNMQSVMSGYKH